jgi:hypothetical protein
MVRNILLLALLLFSLPSYSQIKSGNKFYFTGGYNIGSNSYSGLDYVVERYNSIHSYLTKEMDMPGFFQGFTAGGGFHTGILKFEILYIQKKSSVMSAENTFNSTTTVRDLYVTTNSINLGLAFSFFNRKTIDISAGLSTDIGEGNVFTRTYQKGTAAPDFVNVDDIEPALSNTLIGITIFPQFTFSFPLKGFAIIAKPYFQVQLSDMNWMNTNRILNHTIEPADNLKGRTNNLGFELRLAYFIGI